MVQWTLIRYSAAFKQQVVDDMESGRFDSMLAAGEHYGISSVSVGRWLRKYGKNHLCARVIKVEKPDEQDELRRLKKRIKQLEQALGRTQSDNILNQSFLDIACEELGQDVDVFKKKAATERSIRPANGPNGK